MGGDRQGRGAGARRLALAAAGLAAALGAAAAPAGAEREVRILLLEGRARVSVAAEGGAETRLAATPGGLRAGSRDVGPRWRSEGGVWLVDGLRVRGAVEVSREGAGLQVVNRLPLEQYVAATLGRELHLGFSDEARKAQAVAVRTYALYRAAGRAGAAFDLTADTRGQVYGGADAESAEARAAAVATRGEVLVFGGEPILAAFHSASGGRTASAEEVWGRALPYLTSRPVEDEDSPDTYWRVSLTGDTLGRALAPLGVRVGPVRELQVVQRAPSGRARTVRVVGRKGSVEIDARALRRAVGAGVIRSTLFETRREDDEILLVGSGHGHGVGMSQWGAEAMARRGAGYREILAAFYPGTALAGGVAP